MRRAGGSSAAPGAPAGAAAVDESAPEPPPPVASSSASRPAGDAGRGTRLGVLLLVVACLAAERYTNSALPPVRSVQSNMAVPPTLLSADVTKWLQNC